MKRGFSQEDVFERLKDLHPTFVEVVRAAWKVWAKNLSPYLPLSHPRIARNCMHGLMVKECRDRLDLKGVQLQEPINGHFFVQDRRRTGEEPLLLRVKHLDRRKLSRNFRTPSQIDFELDKAVDLVPSGFRLVLGYQLNQLETEVSHIFIVRIFNRKLVWAHELYNSGTGRVIDTLPQEPLPGLDTRRTAARVRPKKGKTTGKKNKKSNDRS